jgi:hypothetical protein
MEPFPAIVLIMPEVVTLLIRLFPEGEDILEREEHFPSPSEDNLKVCDNLLNLPNKGLKDEENGRSDSEIFLHYRENRQRSVDCVRPFEKKRTIFSPHHIC